MRLSPRLLSVALLLLAGCAGAGRFEQPSDFPLHASDDPFFDLHWRLDRKDGVVEASGLVEAARVSGIAEVILELLGLDKDGRVVSRGLGRTYWRPILRWDSSPFRVRLRPTGREERFELKVWTFVWEGQSDDGERD